MLGKNHLVGAVALLVAGLAAGCGSARVVQRTQYGGTIALNGDRAKAMEQAEKEMSAHCGPGNYQVVREGEVPVGTDTMSRSDTSYGQSSNGQSTAGGETTTAGTSTRTATEWRVEYQCGRGAGGPPPGPGGPGGPPPGPGPGGPPPPPPGY
jgi:hypothetical protein